MPKRYYQEYGPINRRRGYQPQRLRLPPSAGEPLSSERLRRRSPLVWLGLALLLCLLALGIGLAYLNYLYRGRIYPNISIQGVEVGGKSQEQALSALRQRFETFAAQPVVLTYRDQQWQPTLSELGASIEFDEAIGRALDHGRGLNIFASAAQVSQIWDEGIELPLRLRVDGRHLQRYLQEVAAGIDKPAVDAGLLVAFNGAAITPAYEGRLLALDETSADIVAGISTLTPRALKLQTIVLEPELVGEGVREAKRLVDAMLQSPLTLLASDQRWTIGQQELGRLIKLRRSSSGGASLLTVDVDEQPLRERLLDYARQVDRGFVNPRLRFAGGAPAISTPGRSGLRLDVDASLRRIRQTLPSATRELELVVEQIQPEIVEENLETLGIDELVARGQSSFEGSAPYRITNIRAATNLLNGIAIPPGAEFSFNQAIGEIGPENGFVEGYAIIGNRTQLEWGGGVCQTSTTLFRAAFHAGLPISERHEHSFRISWYEKFEPYGMDAAIYTGQLDLRFINDTGHWLLLQTEMDEARQVLTYSFYGTSPDRQVIRGEAQVISQEPAPKAPLYIADSDVPPGTIKQSDTARGGMYIVVERIIKHGDTIISSEPFETRFKPWPNIYLYHPSTPPFKGCNPDAPCSP